MTTLRVSQFIVKVIEKVSVFKEDLSYSLELIIFAYISIKQRSFKATTCIFIIKASLYDCKPFKIIEKASVCNEGL